MSGRDQTPRTPLMVDVILVEIERHLRRALDSARAIEPAPEAMLRRAIAAAHADVQHRLEQHRAENDLGTPNH